MSGRRVTLLGPQRLEPTLRGALADLGVRGRIGVVTAGWEERELETEELAEHVGGEVVNLEVYRRVEDVFRADPELLDAVRERHDRMRKVQDLYRLRLSHALDAARELLARTDDPDLLGPEQEAAIETVRYVDAQHLARIREIHGAFDESWRPGEREAVAREREAVREALDGAEALCVAGGHVAILLNRMRLLDVVGASGDVPIVAWSAGAMTLGERIVLFHDSPPQGAGDAEVLEAGLGVCPDVVPLPHASRRLRLDDPTRVGLFARRFEGAACVALDARARIDWNGERYRPGPGTRRLSVEGTVVEMEAVA